MKLILAVLCFVCILRIGTSVSSEDRENNANVNEIRNKAKRARTDDLEGAETVVFDLKSIFPSYGANPCIRPGRYPSSGGGYYPSTGTGGGYYPSSSGGYYPSYNPSNGYYPSSGSYPTSGYYPSSGQYPSGGGSYYPSGTNILGHGSGSYPSQSFYPISNPYYASNTRTSAYGTTGSSSNYNTHTGYGGYGGYGGNGGFSAYNGYNNPRYDGKRNLGYGYYSDTDRYGFYKSPSQQLSVYRGYN